MPLDKNHGLASMQARLIGVVFFCSSAGVIGQQLVSNPSGA
jgi:hypothetical protein